MLLTVRVPQRVLGTTFTETASIPLTWDWGILEWSHYFIIWLFPSFRITIIINIANISFTFSHHHCVILACSHFWSSHFNIFKLKPEEEKKGHKNFSDHAKANIKRGTCTQRLKKTPTLKKVNIPELADVGVALVQVIHAHPSWGCCWVVLRGDVPEHSIYF